jgi:hypothetical protein
LDQKFLLLIADWVIQGWGSEGGRYDDLTGDLFWSDAGVDAIAYCDGLVTSRSSAR